jgi:hypothetical protein
MVFTPHEATFSYRSTAALLRDLALVVAFCSMPQSVLSADANDIAYVSSQQARLHSEAKLNSEIVGVLNKSDAVEIVDRKKIWMQVKHTDLAGWLSRYSVTNKAPSAESLSIFGRLKNLFDDDNRRSRLTYVSTAGGIRGLTEEESDASGDTDFGALRSLERIVIPQAELDDFISRNSD